MGLGIDVNNEELRRKLDELKQVCINTVSAEIRQIDKDYGVKFSGEDIKNLLSANHNIGRPDIARLCIKYGYAKSVQEAFDKYLIEAHEKVKEFRKNLTYQECINFILDSSGIPILAHPKSLKLCDKELLVLIRDMINSGLRGIEVFHSSHSKSEVDFYSFIANKFGLLVSGGSDYHGSIVKPDILLGTGKNNNLCIRKLSVLNHL